MIRRVANSVRPEAGIDAESERKFIYARRENLPMRARAEQSVRVEEKKGRDSRRRTG